MHRATCPCAGLLARGLPRAAGAFVRGGVRMGDWGWCLVNAPPSQPRSRSRSRGSRTSSHSLSQSQNLALSQPRQQTERVRSSKGFLTAQHCTGLHSLPGSATEPERCLSSRSAVLSFAVPFKVPRCPTPNSVNCHYEAVFESVLSSQKIY